MRWLLPLVALVSCAGKPAVLEIAASRTATVTLSKVGKLSVRLEIRRLGKEVNAVALMTWAGGDSASVDTTLEQYQFTNRVKTVRSVADSLEFDSGQSRVTGTPAALETNRTCASLTLTVSGFNANADEVLESGVVDACEKP